MRITKIEIKNFKAFYGAYLARPTQGGGKICLFTAKMAVEKLRYIRR